MQLKLQNKDKGGFMRRIFLLIIFISPLYLIASDVKPAYLYVEKNRCVDYFYYNVGTLYYKYSHLNREYSTSSVNQHFIPGYEFNTTSQICYVPKQIQDLAMDPKDFHSLMALVAVLVGFTFMFFSIFIFVDVAKK